MSHVRIRPARTAEADAVIALLDQAMLSFDRRSIRDRIHRESVLLATHREDLSGVVVLAGGHIEAIAVKPSRRDEGIGRALIEAVFDRSDRVTAGCHPQARAFYRALDFSLYTLPSGRVFAIGWRSQTSGSMSV